MERIKESGEKRFSISKAHTSVGNRGTIRRCVTVSKNELPGRKSASLYRHKQWEEKITAGQKYEVSPRNTKRKRVVLRHVGD